MRLRSRTLGATLVLSLAARSAWAGAQTTRPAIVEWYARARALLDSAIATHGGLANLRTGRRIALRVEGNDYMRNQSLRVDPPYDIQPITGALALSAHQSVEQKCDVNRGICVDPSGIDDPRSPVG